MAGKKYWIAGYPDLSTTAEGASIASNFFSDSNKEGAEKLIDLGQAIKNIDINNSKTEKLVSVPGVEDAGGLIWSSITGDNEDAIKHIWQALVDNEILI